MPSTVFISYCWDSPAEKNEAWVLQLATRLKNDGTTVILDKWAVQPGDPIAPFMQRAIAKSDKVLIVCTPRYKQSADDERGAVGYESNIISAQIWLTADHRKFITVLKDGNDLTAVPVGLQGKYHIRLNDAAIFEAQYQLLLNSITGFSENEQVEGFDSITKAEPESEKKDYYNLSFALLSSYDKEVIREYIDFYRRQLTENKTNARACFGIGLCYLHSHLFDIACRQLGKAVQLEPATAEYHYYYALALCRGRRLIELPHEEVMTVLNRLQCALQLDGQQAKYYSFLLLLHEEYFKPAGSHLPHYNIESILQQSHRTYRDEGEIERLAGMLRIESPEGFRILFNK
jgi:hypothetical protein